MGFTAKVGGYKINDKSKTAREAHGDKMGGGVKSTSEKQGFGGIKRANKK